jgi:hypothetical protein
VKSGRFISGLRRDRPALGVSGMIRPSLGDLQRDPTAPMVFYGETDRPLVFPARSDCPDDLTTRFNHFTIIALICGF